MGTHKICGGTHRLIHGFGNYTILRLNHLTEILRYIMRSVKFTDLANQVPSDSPNALFSRTSKYPSRNLIFTLHAVAKAAALVGKEVKILTLKGRTRIDPYDLLKTVDNPCP